MDFINVDWTGVFAKAGKGAKRGASKRSSSVKIRHDDDDKPIIRGWLAPITYGLTIVFCLACGAYIVAGFAAIGCTRRLIKG